MIENSVPIEEMTDEELLATVLHAAYHYSLARLRLAGVLGRIRRADYYPTFAIREPCPHFRRRDTGLNPPVPIPLYLVDPALALELAG